MTRVTTSRTCYSHHAFEEAEDVLRCVNCGGVRCEACEGAGRAHFFDHLDPTGSYSCGSEIDCMSECERCLGEGVLDG